MSSHSLSRSNTVGYTAVVHKVLYIFHKTGDTSKRGSWFNHVHHFLFFFFFSLQRSVRPCFQSFCWVRVCSSELFISSLNAVLVQHGFWNWNSVLTGREVWVVFVHVTLLYFNTWFGLSSDRLCGQGRPTDAGLVHGRHTEPVGLTSLKTWDLETTRETTKTFITSKKKTPNIQALRQWKRREKKVGRAKTSELANICLTLASPK